MPVNSFGASVAVDRRGSILVGTPGKWLDGVDGGAVFRFDAASGELLSLIANPAPESGDFFGDSMAVASSDGDDDGDEEGGLLIIGAPRDDDPDGPAGPIPGVVNVGAVFVFDAATDALLRTVANPAPAQGDAFGTSVAVGPVDDDDEGGLLVVGAASDDDADGPGPIPEALNAGAVFLFGGDEDD